jgi:threonine-phosphate decarboxylase
LLPSALQLRHLLVIGTTFSEYARAMERSGGRVSMVLAEREHGYAPPLTRAIDLLDEKRHTRRTGGPRIDAVVLCNPNSPTGQACPVEDVRRIALAASRRKVRFILDETFADYCEGRSILPGMKTTGQAIVLRSFTKFFGLPGLRIGYLIAKGDVAQRIRASQAPWSVNALAQEAACAALVDRRHAARSRSFMLRERARFEALLSKAGCILFPSEANFVLVELPLGWQARTVTATLRRQGLLIRDCSSVSGLNARSIRVAVRTGTENNRLARALTQLLRSR